MRRIAGVLLLLLTTRFAAAYDPLTREQAYDWVVYWLDAEPERVVDVIIAFDHIEHAQPEAVLPDVVVLLEGRDLHLTYEPEPKIDLRLGPFSYGIPLPELEWRDFAPAPPRRIKAFAWGAGVGSVATLALVGLARMALR